MRIIEASPIRALPPARRGLPALVALFGLAMGLLALPRAHAIESLQQFPSSVLAIQTHKGAEWFTVWIADTPERSEQGLMFLQWLPTDQGMLFPQDSPRVMRMWMKNTLIPLDMVFIDAKGRIVSIHERATPRSEDIIASTVPVKAVLELAGGQCSALGIHVGDQVRHALFGAAPAGPIRK
jgi:uncharacterized membrane protein (UPF0127 family)